MIFWIRCPEKFSYFGTFRIFEYENFLSVSDPKYLKTIKSNQISDLSDQTKSDIYEA